MTEYVGYGFDADNITDADWLQLMKKYDKTQYDELEEKVKKSYPVTRWEENMPGEVRNFIERNYYDAAEYLRDIINENEDIGENVVENYDNYLIYNRIAFPEDCARRIIHIPSRDSFITMINKYVPTKHLKFGNLYDGNDWEEVNYFIE